MIFIGQCEDLKGLKNYNQESFDIAVLFDGNGKKLKDAATAGISLDKLSTLW